MPRHQQRGGFVTPSIPDWRCDISLTLRDVDRDDRDLLRYLQPVIWSWRGVAGKGIPLKQTAVSNPLLYAGDFANGGAGGLALRAVAGANSLTVNNAAVAIGGTLSVASLAVTGNATVGGTLGVTGASTLGSVTATSLSTTGALTVDGNSTLGNAVGDTTTISGDATVGRDLGITGELTVGGNSTLGNASTDTVLVIGTETIRATNDQALFLQHTSGDGKFSLGASHAADPTLLFKDNSGDLILTLGNSASTYQATVNGHLSVANVVSSGTVDVQGGTAGSMRAGAVFIGATGASGSENLRVSGSSRFENNLHVTTGGLDVDAGGLTVGASGISVVGSSGFTSGNVTFSGGDIVFSGAHRIDHSQGSATSTTLSNWDGYVEMKFGGNTKRFYYKD